ncbi:hypothetical protein WM25_29690 [Burkholderia ubonensis]|nr:hypothetical protein WM25_29690 [Burkholderia ubonensis]
MAVIALDDISVDIEGSRFDQCVEGLGVLVPFRHEQCIHVAAQSSAVADVGEFAANKQSKPERAVLDDGWRGPCFVRLHFQSSQTLQFLFFM